MVTDDDAEREHWPDDNPSVGLPSWLAETLNYCTRCGATLVFGPLDGDDRERLVCPACGFVAYVNPRLVVTTLPITEAGEVILLRRGIEPGQGLWAQPGGFLEIDETVREGAIRETLEETGLIVEPGEIVGLYSRTQAAVVVIAFEARIVSGELRTNPEALEFGTLPARDHPLGRGRLPHLDLGVARLGPPRPTGPPPRDAPRAADDLTLFCEHPTLFCEHLTLFCEHRTRWWSNHSGSTRGGVPAAARASTIDVVHFT